MTDQSAADPLTADPPSRFVVDWATKLAPQLPAPGAVLDVAMGRGRHALALAGLGLPTFGVDWNLEAIRTARRTAAARRLVIRAWCADLSGYPLPRERFALLVVTRYLDRERLAHFQDAVVPGGFVLYETFTVRQRALGTGPTSPDHLLEPGELAGRFAPFEVVSYEEVVRPEASARLVARRTSRS